MSEVVKMEMSKAPKSHPYGFCPICRKAGVFREDRLNGYDKCEEGHRYLSSAALPRPDATLEEAQTSWRSRVG